MAALFADEDFPFPAVRTLRALGHDVRTTLEAGLAESEPTTQAFWPKRFASAGPYSR